MFKRIVQRKGDGKYAVKRYSLFCGWEYLDVYDTKKWWSYAAPFCWTKDYNTALQLFDFNDEKVIKRK
jgi:hypothetical protein